MLRFHKLSQVKSGGLTICVLASKAIHRSTSQYPPHSDNQRLGSTRYHLLETKDSLTGAASCKAHELERKRPCVIRDFADLISKRGGPCVVNLAVLQSHDNDRTELSVEVALTDGSEI